jgi:membrane protease YdiL (CAAX protease family)
MRTTPRSRRDREPPGEGDHSRPGLEADRSLEQPFPTRSSRKTLTEELLIVLGLSLLPSAVNAIITLFEAPVDRSVTVAVGPQFPLFAEELSSIVFAAVPVWLVIYLVRRNGEGTASIGLRWDRPSLDIGRAVILAAVVGVVGIGVYVAAVHLGVNRLVIPVPPLHRWWTYPVLVLNAAENGVLEEVVVVGYLITRLRQLGLGRSRAVGGSALLRGSYHLYQGWGAFTGNLALGLFFGWLFTRWRRTWPLAIAHTLVDVGAGVLYIALRSKLPSLLGA